MTGYRKIKHASKKASSVSNEVLLRTGEGRIFFSSIFWSSNIINEEWHFKGIILK